MRVSFDDTSDAIRHRHGTEHRPSDSGSELTSVMVNADRHGRRHDMIDWSLGLDIGELLHRDEGMRGVDTRYGKPAHLRDPYRGPADRSCKLRLLEFVCPSVGVEFPSVGSLAECFQISYDLGRFGT
jgi:hypothetical protein